MAKPNRDAEIRKLWAEGVSIGLIAQQIGRDRGMVSGRVRRLGLEQRVTTARLQIEDKPDDPEIRRMWAEGLTTAEIGRRLKRSKNAIVGRAHRLGLPERPFAICLRPPKEEQIEAMRAMLTDGIAAYKIAAALGLHHRTVKDWTLKLGFQLKPQGFARTQKGTKRAVKPPKPARPTQPAKLKVVAPPAIVIQFRQPNARQCEWVEGDRYPYTYCEGEAVHGTSWCDGHGAFCCATWPPRQRRAA